MAFKGFAVSRGAGIIQRAIIEAVSAAEAPVAVESLRWDLFEKSPEFNEEVLDDCSQKAMSMSWYTTFDRALKTLAQKRMVISITSRPLNGLDEFLAHFPDKTRSRVVRDLRRALLPGLVEWVTEEGLRRGFDALGNEAYHLRHATLSNASRLWSEISPKLTSLLSELPPEQAAAVFRVVAKGKEILEDSAIQVHFPFAHVLAECNQKCNLPAGLREKLRELSEAILPSDQAGLLRVKSYVHSIADIGRHGGCRLKLDTLKHLDKHFHHVVSRLPGYIAKPSDIVRGRLTLGEPVATHSPVLTDSLIHQSAFRPFRFAVIA